MEQALVLLSTLGIGGIAGAFVKAAFDKRQFKFSRAFEYKEQRYKAIIILMWVAMHPTKEEFAKLKRQRPDIKDSNDLSFELELEYHNAMLFASDKVLDQLDSFRTDKREENWRATLRAMKRDLYL